MTSILRFLLYPVDYGYRKQKDSLLPEPTETSFSSPMHPLLWFP